MKPLSTFPPTRQRTSSVVILLGSPRHIKRHPLSLQHHHTDSTTEQPNRARFYRTASHPMRASAWSTRRQSPTSRVDDAGRMEAVR
ncbi:hypothetical protein J1614_008934 [Plenodomus biglobosus]|nr:hypothetical protein J1614_008934 [Plenodomus biglobosus]